MRPLRKKINSSIKKQKRNIWTFSKVFGNMQKLQLTVVTMDNKSKEIEERLQQLKEHMSKEKEERGHSRGLKWVSAQHSPMNSNHSTKKKENENAIQKQTGKVKIRVLKPESFTAPLQPPPPPSFRPVGQRTARKNKVQGMICGPCEVKTAGLVMMMNDEEEKDTGGTETAVRRQPSCLLDGDFSEEESARYFQEALKQWRGERKNEKVKPMDATLPLKSAIATQVDLLPNRKAEERRGGEEETPTVRVQFTQNKLTYMDRLLLKKHRRMPTENLNLSLNVGADLKYLPAEDTEEDAACTYTAEEEDLHLYYASLFALPDSSSRTKTKTQIVAPEPCFVMQVLEETNTNRTGEYAQEKKTDRRMVSLVHQVSEMERRLESKTVQSGSSKAKRSSSSAKQPPKQSFTPTQHKTGRKLTPSQLQDAAFEYRRSHISEEHLPPLTLGPFTIRSTFTLSPSSSTESAMLPNIYFPAPQTRSESSFFQEPAFPAKILEAEQDNLTFLNHVQYFKCGTENQLLEDHFTPVSYIPARLHPTPSTLEPVFPQTGPVPCQSHESFTSSPQIYGDLKTNQSSQNTECVASHLSNINANTVKMEEVLELSADSEDEMSSDSLSLASFEEDSSGGETQIQGHLTTKKLKEEQSSVSCFQDESFIPAEPDKEKDLLMDKPERQPELLMVMQSQSVGTGSEHFCDLNGLSPLGLDVTPICHTHSPEHAFCGRQSSLHDLNPTVSVTDKSTSVPSGVEIASPGPLSVPTHSCSQAAKEIMEISYIDPEGCEDPDVDADTVAHILQCLEQELEATAKGAANSSHPFL